MNNGDEYLLLTCPTFSPPQSTTSELLHNAFPFPISDMERVIMSGSITNVNEKVLILLKFSQPPHDIEKLT